ncbi:MAG: carboxypeptidase-like regulatory domain-containing protein [Rhodobacteraceae bacterium]|nr:carboxypeptidase-like regulatory domain-containing protein [Paracoccaceae bacterium]
MVEVADIPGVGPAEAQALAAASVHSADDLLRSERTALARRAPGLAVERIRRWQGWAELAEIRDLPPAAATALQAAGADGVEEFAGWGLARARAALPGAGDEAILGWIRDAVRLVHTGVVNGEVRLRDGTPVAGAAVTVAGRPAVSDARGRFRVLRLALDRTVAVTVHHPALGYRLAPKVAVSRSSALVVHGFVLPGRPAQAPVLSELRGDRLPPVGAAPIAVRSEPGAPDPADILMVIDRHANGDARAASRFLDFAEGRFVRRVYRIAEAELPAGLSDGDDLEWTGTLWAPARFTARDIARQVRLRALQRRFPRAPRSAAELDRFVRALARALSDRRR